MDRLIGKRKTKPSKYNIWHVKSPWLRLPLAGVFAFAAAVAYLGMTVLAVVWCAAEGAWTGAKISWAHMDWRTLWRAMTTWKAKVAS